VLALAALAIFGGCAVASTVPFDFFRSSDRGEFTVFVQLPIGTPLAITALAVRRMEAAVDEVPEVSNVFATVGTSGRRQANIGTLYVDIGSKKLRRRGQLEVMADVRERVLAAVPEAEEVSVGEIGWVSSGGRDKQLDYSLQGPDLDRLERYAAQLMEKMRSHPDFVDVASSFESGKPEIRLTVLRDVAAELGVPASVIGQTLRTLLAGEKVGSFEDRGERYDVRVQVLPEFRDDPAKLDMIRLRSLRGELIPLTNVARAELGEGAVSIERENRTRQISVGANLVGGAPLGPATEAVERWGRELGIASPDALVPGSRARTMRETGGAILFAFLLALGAIYMILASLFNSLIHPFTIMMSAPLSFIGGFLALKLSGLSLDMMSGIGLLVLMGLVMKNGILLVDYTNQLRAEGLTPEAAALEAGPVRMRPVLMTTAALILGLTPVAFGASAGSEARAPMGVITVGGLLTSTLLTLVVVPVVYLQIDRLRERIAGLVARLRPSSGQPRPAAPLASGSGESPPPPG
jgi:HAE1 family hydrophobic/amphiphilic exporter-1